MTPYQLSIAANILVPGSVHYAPSNYSNLVLGWFHADPMPTELALQTAWDSYAIDIAKKHLKNKASELIEGVVGDTKSELNQIFVFVLKLYAHAKGDPTAMADMDAQYAAMVPPIFAIQTHEGTLVASLTAANVASLDVEAGTMTGVPTGWPS